MERPVKDPLLKPRTGGHSFLQHLFQAGSTVIGVFVADMEGWFSAGEQAAEVDGSGKHDQVAGDVIDAGRQVLYLFLTVAHGRQDPADMRILLKHRH